MPFQSVSYTRKPLSLTLHLSSPSRSYTLNQLPLLILTASLTLLILYLMLPPWLIRLTKSLTYLATTASFAYFSYRFLYSPPSPRSRPPIFPSYYEAPGGHKSCISWQVDPAEQERIDRLRGGSHTSQEQRMAQIIEEPLTPLPSKPEEEHKEAEVDTKAKEEKARKALHYSRVHAELLHTEKTYTASLQSCVDCYILPLQQKCNSGDLKLTPADCTTLFSNLQAILSFHSLLLTDLTHTPSPNVGQVFLKYADYLKMYTAYVSNYSACLALVSKLSMNNQFKKFLATQRASKGSEGLDLMSYLIQPIQRIPRYEMLLGQLVKYAPFDQARLSLDTALEKVRAIARLVNERKREAENASFVLEVQNRMKGREVKESLLQPSRKMVRVGEVGVMKVEGKGDKEKRGKRKAVVWVLLTDVLVWCKEDYEWKDEVKGKDVVRVKEGVGNEVWMVYKENGGKGKETTVVVEMKDEDDKQSWLCSLAQFQQSTPSVL